MSNPTLRRGNGHAEVVTIRNLLIQNGFLNSNLSEGIYFDRDVEQAVIYYQQTHSDPQGKALEADGIVGAKTWWALTHGDSYEHGETELANITGTSRQQLDSPFLEVIKNVGKAYGEKSADCDKRLALLNTASGELGAREEPDGSNHGPNIDKVLPLYYRNTRQGPPYCAFGVSWAIQDTFKGEDFGLSLPQGSVRQLQHIAKNKKMFHSEESGYDPIPGDVFIIFHKDGKTGHTGFVLGNKDKVTIWTIEWNCGNAVRSREMLRSKIYGYINLFSDEKKVRLYVEKKGKAEKGEFTDR